MDRRIKGWRKHHRLRRARFLAMARRKIKVDLAIAAFLATARDASDLEVRIEATLQLTRSQDARLAELGQHNLYHAA